MSNPGYTSTIFNVKFRLLETIFVLLGAWRGFCKHIAALAYKLVDVSMGGGKELPKPISWTETRQKRGVPSLRAAQHPKKVMKKKSLQDIVFAKHICTRFPSELFHSILSKPAGEPPINKDDVENFNVVYL